MRLVTIVLIILFLLLQVDIWIKKDGYKRKVELTETIEMQTEANKEMTIRNNQLQQEIIDLRNGTEAIEEKARTEMGMIKEGEEFYLIAK
ncbi:MAG: septum formation initiator family protein [Gammaproteobacteria bacterium]|jgi:cell division protein FtsB|nr:septum formation initiator family protein [Gammaproteobacteria bacterium]|tara:strand:+ start:542 stop:811 length:270 start_codon:yes stop_codon:yes gene_type:complete